MYQLQWFDRSEFDCNCGTCSVTGDDMDPYCLELLDEARAEAGIPFIVNRGASCVEHNRRLGGSRTSSHLVAPMSYAADISCTDSVTRGKMLTALVDAGFRRIGIAGTFLHVDTDPHKPDAVWLYDRE